MNVLSKGLCFSKASGIGSIFHLFVPVIWLHFFPAYLASPHSLILIFYFYSAFLHGLHLIQIYRLNLSLVLVQKMKKQHWVRGMENSHFLNLNTLMYFFNFSFFFDDPFSPVFCLVFILHPFIEKLETVTTFAKNVIVLSRKVPNSFPIHQDTG